VLLVQTANLRLNLYCAAGPWCDPSGDSARVKLPHPEILNTLSVGDTLLLDDGKLRMVVTAKHDGAVDTVVEVSQFGQSIIYTRTTQRSGSGPGAYVLGLHTASILTARRVLCCLLCVGS
jgi:hypothetical protein